MLTLVIGSKNYSSWSMRPWVLMRQAGIPFEERLLRFDSFDPGSSFRGAVDSLGAAGKVPVLLLGDGTPVWDSLAITETLAELFPGQQLWPAAPAARAQARSVAAEMHAGFGALRSVCPMNIEARLPDAGALLWRDQPGLRRDVARLVALWTGLLERHGGPMLFGAFSAADAFFAPVCMRLRTYALPVPDTIAAYVERVAALPGVAAWIEGALAEQDFRAFEEPYRLGR